MVEANAPSGVGVARDDAAAERRTVLLATCGDVEAFEQLVRRYRAYVETLIRRACGSAAQAEDLTQVTFVKAWRSLHLLRDGAAFRTWLRRIALNVVVDAMRRSAREVVTLSEDGAAGADRVSEPLEDAVIARMDVDRALATLSFGQRACIVLSYGEKMSHPEIAAALEMPIGTVKSHIARGLTTLRGLLHNREGHHERA
jgi:RNA polymerase sigma-70 factor (ECF subfamily)